MQEMIAQIGSTVESLYVAGVHSTCGVPSAGESRYVWRGQTGVG